MNTTENTIKEITPEELEEMSSESYILIDTREESDYNYGAVPGCIYISKENLLSCAAAEDPCSALLSACASSSSSGSSSCTEGVRDAGGLRSGSLLVVLYSSRDDASRWIASLLEQAGLNAAILAGGYSAWALHEVTRKGADAGFYRSEIEKSIQKRFHGRLMGPFARAILKYDMIREGDRIAVCISGGKDSMLMAKLFQEFQKHGHVPFELRFIVMDPGYSDANRAMIENNIRLLGIPADIFETRIFDAVYTIENSPCYLCARMRRGYLYRKASDLGCNKIALGHHYDDVIETALMGMLYSGQWSAMMPKLWSTNFPGMELIRPMYFIREEDIRLWRDANHLYFLQCACRFTEENTYAGAESHSASKRQETKRLIANLKKTNPQIETNIFHATENVTVDKLLGYKKDGVRHSFLDTYSL